MIFRQSFLVSPLFFALPSLALFLFTFLTSVLPHSLSDFFSLLSIPRISLSLSSCCSALTSSVQSAITPHNVSSSPLLPSFPFSLLAFFFLSLPFTPLIYAVFQLSCMSIAQYSWANNAHFGPTGYRATWMRRTWANNKFSPFKKTLKGHKFERVLSFVMSRGTHTNHFNWITVNERMVMPNWLGL